MSPKGSSRAWASVFFFLRALFRLLEKSPAQEGSGFRVQGGVGLAGPSLSLSLSLSLSTQLKVQGLGLRVYSFRGIGFRGWGV